MKASGSTSSREAMSSTMPGIAASGAASSISVAVPAHAALASASRLKVLVACAQRATEDHCGGSRARMSRRGASTATIAASMPPPVAIATLCQLTTRWEPTANASDRKAGFECSR